MIPLKGLVYFRKGDQVVKSGFMNSRASWYDNEADDIPTISRERLPDLFDERINL